MNHIMNHITWKNFIKEVGDSIDGGRWLMIKISIQLTEKIIIAIVEIQHAKCKSWIKFG